MPTTANETDWEARCALRRSPREPGVFTTNDWSGLMRDQDRPAQEVADLIVADGFYTLANSLRERSEVMADEGEPERALFLLDAAHLLDLKAREVLAKWRDG